MIILQICSPLYYILLSIVFYFGIGRCSRPESSPVGAVPFIPNVRAEILGTYFPFFLFVLAFKPKLGIRPPPPPTS